MKRRPFRPSSVGAAAARMRTARGAPMKSCLDTTGSRSTNGCRPARAAAAAPSAASDPADDPSARDRLRRDCAARCDAAAMRSTRRRPSSRTSTSAARSTVISIDRSTCRCSSTATPAAAAYLELARAARNLVACSRAAVRLPAIAATASALGEAGAASPAPSHQTSVRRPARLVARHADRPRCAEMAKGRFDHAAPFSAENGCRRGARVDKGPRAGLVFMARRLDLEEDGPNTRPPSPCSAQVGAARPRSIRRAHPCVLPAAPTRDRLRAEAPRGRLAWTRASARTRCSCRLEAERRVRLRNSLPPEPAQRLAATTTSAYDEFGRRSRGGAPALRLRARWHWGRRQKSVTSPTGATTAPGAAAARPRGDGAVREAANVAAKKEPVRRHDQGGSRGGEPRGGGRLR